jgi:DHA2 family multidrug resistance protein-like MFS transporter
MMGCIVFGAEMFARAGAGLGAILVLAGLAAGAALVRREWSEKLPLMPLDLLRIPIFTLSISTSVVSFAAQMLAYVALPFLLQSVLGRSVFATGLLMTPWPIAVGIAAPIAGRLADRVPAGLLGGIGLAIFAAGLFFLSGLSASPGNFDIAWRMAVCGLGFGLFQSPNNRTIVSAAPKARSGAAGGMLATARLLGQTTGAVTVGMAFHIAGVRATPGLLLGASIVALVAAGISLLRLSVPPPGRVAVYKPILE